jgi:hypothetical protein
VVRAGWWPLRSEPPLPVLPYSFQWWRCDNRPAVALVCELALQLVDFSDATPSF